jgi:hypothetical protein
MSSQYKTTVTVGDDQDVEILVQYTAYPFIRGARDGRYGPPLEPDEPAHLEIESIEVVGGDVSAPGITTMSNGKRYIELSEDQENRLIVEVGEYLSDMEDAAREDW